MLRVTPRATVVQALARREAELLDQPVSSGHVLVALIWEGGGIGAAALADCGLRKGADDAIRERLATAASSTEIGVGAMELQVRAGTVAAEMGHDYVGTEHQLLAITEDTALSETILSRDARARAAAGCRERLERPPAA
jgi:hypothetical protein